VLSSAVPSCVSVQSWGWQVTAGHDGCIINATLIPGQIEVDSSNVTIVDSRVMCSSDACISQAGASTGLTVSHTEIGPNSGYANVNGARGIDGAPGLTVEAVNIHNTVDGIWPGSNSAIRDSYIHNLDITNDGAHSDGIQSTGGTSNVQVTHNTIEGGNTSDLLVQKLDGLDNAWVIDGNLLLGVSGSGGVTSYAVGFDAAACPANTCEFRGNVLNRTWEVGPSYTPTNWTAASWSGNTYQDNGATVPVP
jgi:hypothetical protein